MAISAARPSSHDPQCFRPGSVRGRMSPRRVGDTSARHADRCPGLPVTAGDVCPTAASFLSPDGGRHCHKGEEGAVNSITTFAGSSNEFGGQLWGSQAAKTENRRTWAHRRSHRPGRQHHAAGDQSRLAAQRGYASEARRLPRGQGAAPAPPAPPSEALQAGCCWEERLLGARGPRHCSEINGAGKAMVPAALLGFLVGTGASRSPVKQRRSPTYTPRGRNRSRAGER
jgi:hypothetical protein